MMNITEVEYTQYLRLDECYNFVHVMIHYIKNGGGSSYLFDLEFKRHIHILDEIGRAGFARGDTDVPF